MTQKNLNKLYPKIDGGTASTFGFGKLTFIKTDTTPTAVEGVIYYDDSENKFKMCTDGSTWTAISAANAATTGLDGAYDLNNGITVDGSPVTLTHTGTTYDGMQITSAVVTANDKALLDLVWTGTPHAGANLLRLDGSGMTTTNTPYLMEVAADAKDVAAIYIDTDAATDHQIYVLDAGNLGAGKAQLYLDYDGTPNATATLLTLDATGVTATNTPYAMKIDSHGIDMAGLYIDADAATDDAVVINGGGAIADNKALLDIVADGTPAATGSNLLRVDVSGATCTNKPTAIEVVGTGVDAVGMIIDTDSVGNVMSINGGGNIADGAGVLALTQDGGTQSAGGCILVLTNSGTADTDSRYIEIVGDGVDARAIYCDTDSATNDGVYILNQGNIASGKAAVHIDIDGTPNAAGMALYVDGTGATMSGTPNLVKFDTSTKDATALYIDSDSATDGCVIINSGGNLADNKAVLELKWDGTPAAAGTNMLRVDGSGGTNTAKPVLVEIYDDSVAVGLSVNTASVEDVVSITGSGNTGANKAVVDINWGAVTPNAAGNLLRLDATAATTTSVPICFEVVGAGEVARAIYTDVDTTGAHSVQFHCGGALTDGYGVVGITNDGNLATGGNLLNVTMGGTPHTAAAAVEISAAKDAYAFYVTSSAATNSGIYVTNNGAIADNKAVMELVATGTPAATGSNILRVDGSGMTATNKPILVEVVGAGKTVRGLYIDTDIADNHVAAFHGGGALEDGKAVLALTNDGNLATGGNLLNVTVGGTPHTAAAAVEIASAKDCKALDITTSAATNSAVKITGVGAVANDMALLHVSHGTGAIVAGGSLVRIEGNANAGGATAYGMTINCNATNLEALWVEAGTVLIAEQLTATGGVVTKLGTTADLTNTTPTSAEFDTAFGAANKTKGGFIGVVEDSGSGVAYIVFSDGTTWHFVTGTGAAA